MSKWMQRVVSGIILLIVVLLANTQLLITLFVPPPIYYSNVPFPVDKQSYTSGEIVYVTVERCSREQATLPGTFSLNIISADSNLNWQAPDGSVLIPPGCVTAVVALANRFPDDLPSGTYKLQGVLTVRGTFKTADIIWETQKFTFANTRKGGL